MCKYYLVEQKQKIDSCDFEEKRACRYFALAALLLPALNDGQLFFETVRRARDVLIH